MTISEKSAYLKGLMDGLNLNTETNEGKMIAAIVDLLGDVTRRLTDVEETTIAISDELDEIEEDLDAIEDFILDEDDYDDDEDWDDEDEDEDWDDEDEDYDEERIEIYMDPNLKTITVGNAVVSDDPANESIAAVAEAAGVAPETLVALTTEGNAPLVFEFLDPADRNEVTLKNVYFIGADGKVTMPSRKDNDNILAFGKAFISDVYGFKAFLDRTK